MYEPRHVPPIPFAKFVLRMLVHAGTALVMMGISLLAGIVGYMHYEHLQPLDAFLNAAMLLGGMGPVKTDLSAPGKLFAGCYALYSGLFFVAVMGVVLAPAIHRVLHTLHWAEEHGAA
jgi:hypothetical protein